MQLQHIRHFIPQTSALSLAFCAAFLLSEPSSYGAGSSAISDSEKSMSFFAGVTKVTHSVLSDGTEKVSVEGGPFLLQLVNKSRNLSAARMLTACLKLALTAKTTSDAGIFTITRNQLTTRASDSVYYEESGTTLSITLNSGFPKTGETSNFGCFFVASSSGGEI